MTGMSDREKVIKGLEKIAEFFKARGDMAVGDGKMLLLSWMRAAEDALALLKAQEPRVMTLEEVKSCENPVWLEWNYYFMKPALLHSEEVMTDDNRKAVTFLLFGDEEWYIYADDDYGKEIRCWTSRPTDEQREAEPWLT